MPSSFEEFLQAVKTASAPEFGLPGISRRSKMTARCLKKAFLYPYTLIHASVEVSSSRDLGTDEVPEDLRVLAKMEPKEAQHEFIAALAERHQLCATFDWEAANPRHFALNAWWVRKSPNEAKPDLETMYSKFASFAESLLSIPTITSVRVTLRDSCYRSDDGTGCPYAVIDFTK